MSLLSWLLAKPGLSRDSEVGEPLVTSSAPSSSVGGATSRPESRSMVFCRLRPGQREKTCQMSVLKPNEQRA